MFKKVLFAIGMLFVLAALVVACAPAATPTATEAPATVAPTVAAPTGVPATPTADPAVAAQALFAPSAHANVDAEAFKHWNVADPKEVPTSCAKCHTAAGFQDFVADGKVDAAVPAPAGPFTCEMCHNDAAKALTSVTFPSGAVIENLGPEAICMTCHQGRESKVSLDAKFAKFGENLDPDAIRTPYKDDKGKDVKLSFSNVHYFAAGGTLYGSQVHMGYEYDGKGYDIKNQHVDGFNTCLGCHDQLSQK